MALESNNPMAAWTTSWTLPPSRVSTTKAAAKKADKSKTSYKCQRPQIRMDASDWNRLKKEASDYVVDTIQRSTSWYYRFHQLKASYKRVHEKNHVRGYFRKPNTILDDDDTLGRLPGAGGNRELLCHAAFDMDLDDIAFSLYCDDSQMHRTILLHLYDGLFHDGGILDIVEHRTIEDPFRFLGAKWVAFDSLAPAFFRSREYVFYEYSGSCQDLEGRRVLYQYLQSIPTNDNIEHGGGFAERTRGTIHQVSFFREQNGSVQLFVCGAYDMSSPLPAWVTQRGMAVTFSATQRIRSLFDTRAILASRELFQSKSEFSDENAPQPLLGKNVKGCFICRKKFNMLRGKYNCSHCHHPICRHCAVAIKILREIEEADDTSQEGIEAPIASRIFTERICLSCVVQARKQCPSQMRANSLTNDKPRKEEIEAHRRRSFNGTESRTMNSPLPAKKVNSSSPLTARKSCNSSEDETSSEFSSFSTNESPVESISQLHATERSGLFPLATEAINESTCGVSSVSWSAHLDGLSTQRTQAPEAVFSQMAQGLAAQQALLQQMNEECRRRQVVSGARRRPSGLRSSRRVLMPTHRDSHDNTIRFEVL